MDNYIDGQGHKDKYLGSSREIVSKEMHLCNIKALILIELLCYDKSYFF